MRGEHAETAGCAVARSRAAAPSRVRAPRVRELLREERGAASLEFVAVGLVMLLPLGLNDSRQIAAITSVCWSITIMQAVPKLDFSSRIPS